MRTLPNPHPKKAAQGLTVCGLTLTALAFAAAVPITSARAGQTAPKPRMDSGAHFTGVSASPGTNASGSLRADCTREWPLAPASELTLPDALRIALCQHPQTRIAWDNARQQAAQAGVAASANTPNVNLSLGGSVQNTNTSAASSDTRQSNISLSATYLLYDFGARAANQRAAQELLTALNATHDAALRSVFLGVLQAWYQWQAAQATVSAGLEAERVAQENLHAAQTKQDAGVATKADRLQALTAWSQARLTRIKAEGAASVKRGSLAVALGLDANTDLPMQAQALPDSATGVTQLQDFEANLDTLINTARSQRPDLAAAQAQARAANAELDAASAANKPTISLSANAGRYNSETLGRSSSSTQGSLGLTLTYPLIDGANQRYKIQASMARRDASLEQERQTSQQISLDVWNAYYTLRSSTQAVRASNDLLASANESLDVARGRYQAGVGGILELLNAQNSLASAKQQAITSYFDWKSAQATLAQALGQLDFTTMHTP